MFAVDITQNHESLVDLYDATLEKLNIMFGLAKGKATRDIDIIDTVFRGSKTGVVVAIQIDI